MTFEQLRQNKPTAEWLERDEDGEFFNEENIQATNEVLDAYVTRLEKLGGNPAEAEVMKAVEEVVTRLNELNEEYEAYIETLEREELCEFIDAVARLAGLESEGDITEEWREW
jgi:hypothetical protein